MGRIIISALKTGMVLSEDVKDQNGRLLVKAGESLTDKHIRILRIWGVTEAAVEGVDRERVEDEAVSEIDPEVLARADEAARDMFRFNDLEHEAAAELFRYCVIRKARMLMSSSQSQDQAQAGKAAESAPADQAFGPDLEHVDPAALIMDDMRLGSLPVVFYKLVDVINDSRSSASDVAEVISNDPDLSARVLKVVNSPFYGLGSRVDTVSRAVAIIGSNQLISMAMGISVVTFFKGIPNDLITMESFWKHSISCGIGARILSSYLKAPNTERFFVAGLLHDIGRLIIFKELPGYARVIFSLAEREEELLSPLEQRVLGFSHEELGGLLMKKWKLPVSLENNIRGHHRPQDSPNPLEPSLLHIANVMANALELGSSGELYAPKLEPKAWELFGAPVSVITQTAMQMEYQVDEILSFFTSE